MTQEFILWLGNILFYFLVATGLFFWSMIIFFGFKHISEILSDKQMRHKTHLTYDTDLERNKMLEILGWCRDNAKDDLSKKACQNLIKCVYGTTESLDEKIEKTYGGTIDNSGERTKMPDSFKQELKELRE